MPSNSTNVCKVVNDNGVTRGSSIKVSEGLCPKRIVLRHLEGRKEFVVHNEYMNIGTEDRTVDGVMMSVAVFSHSHFDHGDYFSYNEFSNYSIEEAHARAMARFNERAEGFRY